MSDKSFVVCGNNEGILGDEGSRERLCIQFYRRSPLQRFTDDMLRVYGHTKNFTADPSDLLLLFFECATARHRRRRADELNGLPGDFQTLPHAAHQERDIGALPSTVGMELIQHHKTQASRALHQPALKRACHDELEHDVVCQKDIGRIVDDTLALFIRVLPGIAF